MGNVFGETEEVICCCLGVLVGLVPFREVEILNLAGPVPGEPTAQMDTANKKKNPIFGR
jgi:hypothetical protein